MARGPWGVRRASLLRNGLLECRRLFRVRGHSWHAQRDDQGPVVGSNWDARLHLRTSQWHLENRGAGVGPHILAYEDERSDSVDLVAVDASADPGGCAHRQWAASAVQKDALDLHTSSGVNGWCLARVSRDAA